MLQLFDLSRQNAALKRALLQCREDDEARRRLLASIYETWTGRS
jgi:hypothetical protein